jgi:hypothetical protein
VRIADTLFRGGHLSEERLTEAWYTGARPAHLDQCDACAERALDLARWLDDTKQLAVESADAVFTPERLAAQQSQILRKLELIERPSKLLSFPGKPVTATASDFQVPAPQQHIGAWISVAAACLVLGVIGGRLSVWQPTTPTVQSAKVEPVVETPKAPVLDQYPSEIDQPELSSLSALEKLTQPVVVARASTTSRR